MLWVLSMRRFLSKLKEKYLQLFAQKIFFIFDNISGFLLDPRPLCTVLDTSYSTRPTFLEVVCWSWCDFHYGEDIPVQVYQDGKIWGYIY